MSWIDDEDASSLKITSLKVNLDCLIEEKWHRNKVKKWKYQWIVVTEKEENGWDEAVDR